MNKITYKTENQIYSEFKTFIETALIDFTITGWEVKQLYQTIKTEDLKPCIYISILRNNQKGSQYRENITQSEKYYKKYSNKQEISIRFQATRRRKIADTINTYNGIDILKYIRTYLQSLVGIKMMSLKGYAQYRATNIQNQTFTNDDENIQLMPYFDCDYLYTDSFANEINKINDVIEKEQKGF